MGHFVGDDPFQLQAVKPLKQPPGYGDQGLLRVPAGGEGIGHVGFNDIDPGHRPSRGDAEAFHHVIEVGFLFLADRMGSGHGGHHVLAAEVSG